MKTEPMLSEDLGDLFFGQLHPDHQGFFDEHYGQHTRVKLRDLPHYTFWRDSEYKNPEESNYYRYLQESWKFYFPQENTHQKRMDKIQSYLSLSEDIKLNGIKDPVSVVVACDGSKIIIDGNHRVSLGYYCGMDVQCKYLKLKDVLLKTVRNEAEFYGTKNNNRPYQSIFNGTKEVVKGRRRDILERFKKLDIPNDIRSKSVADLGSNVAISAMLAWHFGAKDVTAMEYSPKIASSALRLSAILNKPIRLIVQDLGEPIPEPRKYDTVFCFSLYAHVSDKNVLEQNINEATGSVLYFEGHEKTSRDDYEHIFRHFSQVENLGFNQDGIHSRQSTRPFFRCVK